MPTAKFTKKTTISKALLQNIYDSIGVRGKRFSKLADALTEFSDSSINLFDEVSEKLIDDLLKALLGKELYEDWDYLLTECPYLRGGRAIEVDGEDYRIYNVDTLWEYWEAEGIV